MKLHYTPSSRSPSSQLAPDEPERLDCPASKILIHEAGVVAT